MSSTNVTTASRSTRVALMVGGVVGVLFGIAVLSWPTKAAVAVTMLIAAWALVAGLTYVFMSIFAKEMGVGARIGHVLLGLLYIVAGIVAFSELQQSAAFLTIFVTVMVGIMWIIEGFTALFTLGGNQGSRILTIVFAIISIIAGVTLVTSPLWGALFLWWLVGISLLVLGVINFLRGLAGSKSDRG